MQTTYDMKPAMTPVRPLFKTPKPKTPKRNTDPSWHPEPCPLTREELRRIVMEQIG